MHNLRHVGGLAGARVPETVGDFRSSAWGASATGAFAECFGAPGKGGV